MKHRPTNFADPLLLHALHTCCTTGHHTIPMPSTRESTSYRLRLINVARTLSTEQPPQPWAYLLPYIHYHTRPTPPHALDLHAANYPFMLTLSLPGHDPVEHPLYILQGLTPMPPYTP
jgi:hypothetical protein